MAIFKKSEKSEKKEKKSNVLLKQIKLKPAQIVIGITIIAFVLFAFILTLSSFLTQNNKILNKEKEDLSSELARAMTYDQLEAGDEDVIGTENVKFKAFFLRDLNGDGYAESLKGTCKQLGEEDTLYMELIVQTAGYLKNAKIEIDGKNFYYATALPKDEQYKENYMGVDIKKIEFNNIENGTQKLITGFVRSGNYSYSSSKYSAIGTNINNYSRDDNAIVLTGTYVDELGNETEIIKEIPITIDWYGMAVASIYNNSQTYYDVADRVDVENQEFTLKFSVNTKETKEQLNIYSNHLHLEF